MLPLDLDRTALVRRVRLRRGKLTGVAVTTTTATAARVEEEELDGEGRKRLRLDSSSDSQRRRAPGWSNAAACFASSTSPALQASMN
jgi:hypothetical protein